MSNTVNTPISSTSNEIMLNKKALCKKTTESQLATKQIGMSIVLNTTKKSEIPSIPNSTNEWSM